MKARRPGANAAAALAGLAWFAAGPAPALTLTLPPGAEITADRHEDPGSYTVPTGPWREGQVPGLPAEGAVQQTAWRLSAPAAAPTTLAILAPLRDQLAAAGFETLFQCDAPGCGGFDFRYATPVLAEPDMHVDLGDYRFLAARRESGARPEYVSLLVSRSAQNGYVQITRVGLPADPPLPVDLPLPADPGASPAPALPGRISPPLTVGPVAEIVTAAPTTTKPVPPDAPLAERLAAGFAVTLEDLVFASGAAELDAGVFPSLAALADYLRADGGRRVILVGHTDASGQLEGNIDLSQRRAGSVAQRLTDAPGIVPAQVSAQGVGPLAPRASNFTAEGRALNRRVEVVPVEGN